MKTFSKLFLKFSFHTLTRLIFQTAAIISLLSVWKDFDRIIDKKFTGKKKSKMQKCAHAAPGTTSNPIRSAVYIVKAKQ